MAVGNTNRPVYIGEGGVPVACSSGFVVDYSQVQEIEAKQSSSYTASTAGVVFLTIAGTWSGDIKVNGNKITGVWVDRLIYSTTNNNVVIHQSRSDTSLPSGCERMSQKETCVTIPVSSGDIVRWDATNTASCKPIGEDKEYVVCVFAPYKS